jgi:hypothetical protein
LYAQTRDLSPLEQFYKYKKISGEYLINYYLDHNDVEKAFNIAQQWKDSNPFDFNAKFAYLKVLEKINYVDRPPKFLLSQSLTDLHFP